MPKRKPFSFPQFVEHMKVAPRQMAEATFTKPDDDWGPILHLQRQNGELGVGLLPNMPNEQAKDRVAAMVAESVREANVQFVSLVMSSWMVVLKEGDADAIDLDHPPSTYADLGVLPPSQHPNRQETLVVIAMSATETVMMVAPIERHEDAPPTLGEWEVHAENVDRMGLTGRWMEAIQPALKEVAGD